jgi:hypothetical protein
MRDAGQVFHLADQHKEAYPMAKKAPPAKKPALAKAAAKAPAQQAAPAAEAEVEEEIEEDPEAEEGEVEEAEAENEEAEEGEAENEEGSDFDNLLDAIRVVDPKFGQTAKEDDQIFFKRMITAISEFPEDPDDANSCPLFDGLSESAQGWYNTQGELMNGGKALSAPDGFVSKKGVPPAAGRKAGAKAPRKAGAKREAPKRESKITIRIREVIYEDPTRDLDAVMAELAHRGFSDIKRSTVSTCRSGCMMTVRVLKTLFPKQNLWK